MNLKTGMRNGLNINYRYSIKDCQTLMKKNNPVFIPRNNIVEEAINNAVDGNMYHLKHF